MWCFVCDAPAAGDVCPVCGRPGTEIPDSVDDRSGTQLTERMGRIPRGVWIGVVLVVVIVLFAVMQSGFHLE